MNNTFNDKKNPQNNVLNISEPPTWSTNRISLSSEEYVYYVNLFNLNDKYEHNYIDNKTASSFLQNSGLSIAVLHSIWEYSDIQNKGYLTLEDFFICCRLVAHAQNGNPLSSDMINRQPPCLPSFDIIRHKSFSNISNLEGTIDWGIEITEKEEYKRIFKKLDINNEEKIEGNMIREYYLNTSNISICELMQIWNISDYDNDGYLDFDQFCVMNKIVEIRKVKEINIPLSIPKKLFNSINPDRNLVTNDYDNASFKHMKKGIETHGSDKLSCLNLLKTENNDKEGNKYEHLKDEDNVNNYENVPNYENANNENTDNEKLNMEFDFFEFKNEESYNSQYEKKKKKKKKKRKKKIEEKALTYNEEGFENEEMDPERQKQKQKDIKNKNEKKNEKEKMKKKTKQRDQGEGWKEKWKEKINEKIDENISEQNSEKINDMILENISSNRTTEKNKDIENSESRNKMWKKFMNESKLVKLNYRNIKNPNIESKDIYKIEELNKKLEGENIERKINIEKQKNQLNRLSYIYEHELKRYQCLKDERRNLEFLNICLYKDIKYKKENIKNIKKEIKELINDINKINIENLNINKSYIKKEKDVRTADQKRKDLEQVINKEKKYLKKDEKNLIMLKNMILYLRKQKSQALKLQNDLKGRYDVTNTDYQLLVKNVFHQQNNLNNIINKRLDLEKVKNQQIVLFNSLSNQSILLDLKNKYPQLKKTLESQSDFTFQAHDNPPQSFQRKYFVDKKGIPNELNREIKSTKKNIKNFENIKNGDSVDIFSSLDEMDSFEDIPEEENGSSSKLSLKDGDLKSDENSP